ncbi:MAG TPA: sensor histidine kinase [Cyclobacteriaceae bacterium]|nr:sensor histidine kinase [Cyclobacteriaceae bacterium]
MKWLCPWLAMVVLPLFVGAQAPRPDTLKIKSAEVRLAGQNVSYFVDTTNQLSLEQLSTEAYQRQFKPADVDVPNFIEASCTVWFRLLVKNETDHQLHLRIANPYIPQLNIYTITSDGPQLLANTGFSRLYNTRGISGTNFIVPLPVSHGKTITLMGKMHQPFWAPLEVGDRWSILNKERQSQLLNIFILGILLVMLFYNLVLYFFIRDIIYVYYVVYVFSAILYLLLTNSLLFEWFWPNDPEWNQSMFPVSLVFFTLLVFANQVMSAKKVVPRLYQFSYILFGMMAVITLDFFIHYPKMIVVVNLLATLAPLYVMLLLIYQLRNKFVLAYLFLIGWLPVLATSLIYTLAMRGIFYNEFILSHSVGVSMAWEATVFSLVLGYRYNVFRLQKLAMERENIRMVKDHNKMLEAKVEERTREIMHQNEELVQRQHENQEQQRIIKDHNRQLEAAVERRTLQLEESNMVLRGQMHKLEQFNFIIAHNLRSPVARLLGLSNIFNRNNLSDPINEVVMEKTHEAANDLDKVINDLGDILNLQEGKEEQWVDVNLIELINKIKARFAAECESSKAVLEIQLGTTIMRTVPAYIDSILSNLISNSLKHHHRERTPRILIRVTQTVANYKILVRDNGKGFDREKYADKIFEPFQRFDLETAGKGLGLFLVKTQTASLKGHVYIQSKEGIGTEVEIVVPIPKSGEPITVTAPGGDEGFLSSQQKS